MFKLFRRADPPRRNRGFCKSCTHQTVWGPTHLRICNRPTSEDREPVTGQPVSVVGRPCVDERADEAACGPNGRHFLDGSVW